MAITALLVVLCLSGCTVSAVSKSTKDGEKFSAWNARALWQSKGVKLDYQHTNGVHAVIDIDQSDTDTKAVGSVSEGFFSAIIKVFTGR